MKFTSIFVGAFATLAAAAPAAKESQEKRNFAFGGFNQFNTGVSFGTGFDVVAVDNFAFQNLNLAYLAAFNGFQNDIFSNLVVNQALAFEPFEALFAFGADQSFLQLDHVLGLQSALILSWMGNAGVLNGVSFGGGALPLVDFGSLGGVISPASQFQLGVDETVTSQITTFVQDTGRKSQAVAGVVVAGMSRH